MRRVVVAIFAILIVAAPFIVTVKPSVAKGYSPAYYALRDNLLTGRQWHVEWVVHLERNPGASIPPDVGSLERQRYWVRAYDLRLHAIWLLANGVTTWENGVSIYDTTFADFAWNREQHLRQATWPYTFSGRDWQYFFAEQYTWRIVMLQLIASENWPAAGGWTWPAH